MESRRGSIWRNQLKRRMYARSNSNSVHTDKLSYAEIATTAPICDEATVAYGLVAKFGFAKALTSQREPVDVPNTLYWLIGAFFTLG